MAQGEPSKGRVPEHTAFDNVSIGVEASTTGIGLSVATPLHRAFTLRGGFNVLPFSYRYTYDDFDPLMVAGTEVSVPGLEEENQAIVNSVKAASGQSWV